MAKVELSQRVILLRGKPGCLHNMFLKHYLSARHFQNLMVTQSSGTTATGIQRRKFEQLPVPLPSIEEQLAISSILDQADLTLQRNEVALQKSRHVKTGLMQDLLTGRIRVTKLLRQA